MPVVSAGDLTSLRSENQKATVRISWLVPPVLWQARVNDGSIVKGATLIQFDIGTGSHFSMVEGLQEVWVGSAAGQNDVGRLRVKTISSGDSGVTGTLTVASHSHPLQDDLYLTFLHDYPLKPKYSYIDYIADPTGNTWKMDDNVDYTDQHSEPAPVVIAGPHRAGWLDPTSGDATFNVDASASYTIASGATKSSYALSVASTADTAVVNFNTGTGLGDITFDTAGYYWAKYSVTDSNGKTQSSYRCYIIHDSEEGEPTTMFIDCSGVQLEADFENGGWTASVKAEDKMSLAEIPDHALCIVWHIPIFEGVPNNQITFLPDNNPAVFVGYVREDSGVQQMGEGFGEVDLTLSTVEGRLRRMFTFSTSLIVTPSTPDHWWEYEEWQTCGTIVHDLFLWRSTLLEIADVIGLRDDTLNRMFQGFDEGNVYDNANTFLYSEGIRKRVVCDQGGRVHIVEDQQLMIDSARSGLTTAMEFIQTETIADYGAALTIQRRPEFEAPFVTANGIYWDGATWFADEPDRPESTGEYCSIAPGGKPLWEGPDPQDYPKQTVASQDHLNKICGRYEAKVNNPFVEIAIEFHGMYNTVLDIAYGEQYIMDLQTTETPREIVWSNKPLYCRHIQAVYDAAAGMWEVSASFEPENITTDGIYTECPSFPVLGGVILPVIDGGEDAIPGALITGASVNFKPAPSDLWDQRLTQDVKDMIEDPHWRSKASSTAPSDAILLRCGTGYVKRTTDAFESVDVDVTPSNAPPNDAGDSPAPTATGVTYMMAEGSYPTQNQFVFLARWQNASSEWRSWIVHTDDNGTTWSWEFLGEVASGCEEFGTKSSNFSVGAFSTSWLDIHSGNPILNVAADKYVILYEDTSEDNTYVRAFSMSGDTISWGSAVDIDASSAEEGGQLFLVDTDKFGVAFRGSTGIPTIKIGTLSGTTISLGSVNNILNAYEMSNLTDLYAQDYGISASSPSTSSVVVTRFGKIMETSGDDCVMSATYGEWLLWGSISGTSITWQTWTDCGDVDLETVGKWREAVTGLNVLDRGLSVSIRLGSIGLTAFSYDSSPTRLAVVGYNATENNKSALVAAAADISGVRGFCLFELTSVKAIAIWHLYTGSVYELYGAAISMSGVTPSVGSANLLKTSSGSGDWFDDLYGTALTSTEVVVSYTVYGGDCQTNLILDISGNTITVSETCDSMNEYSAGVLGHTTTKYMLMGWDELSSWNGVIWTGITADDVSACSGSVDSYAMGLSMAKDVGGIAWVTAGNDTILELLEVTLSTMTIANRFSLGNATIAQVIAQTYLAYPFVPYGYDDAVYVYGRMNDPQSLGSPSHIIRTTDGGSSFGLIEDGWGVDHGGALALSTSNYLFAIRNTPGGSKLYVDDADNFPILKLTMPFPAQIAPHGMFLNYYTLGVYTIAWTGNSYMVAKVASPYLSATNMTFDHDTADGGVSIIQL